MYRPAVLQHQTIFNHRVPIVRQRDTLSRTIVPIILWICVSLTLRYGYYGNHQLVLGPNSSRLLQASSLFVEEIQVRDEAQKGIFLYGFSQKPQLLHQANWTISQQFSIHSFRRRGFSLWLNKGSRIRVRWAVNTHRFYDDILVVFLKGEDSFRRWMKDATNPHFVGSRTPTQGIGGGDYSVDEDDIYYIGTVNLNGESVVMRMDVDVCSKIYDTSKADCKCSSIEKGLCSLKLLFPNTHYALLATPNNNVTGDANAWYVELSFAARLATYIVILGFIVVIICLVLKYLGACDVDSVMEEVNQNQNVNETDALVAHKEVISCSYGSVDEEDIESAGMSSSPSEDLYDGKICVICYDEPRNSFFIPCGHCATCYTCAQRIESGENKCCPICRRLIHKIRRLINS